ncbi:MAG TPA: hypothetical protein PLS63_00600 [Microthrixaceae bacterium]|jgi:hypothetical protein|nr:hypothetical protein [Microthrixaceae bacterium]
MEEPALHEPDRDTMHRGLHRRHVLYAAGVLGTVTAIGMTDAGAAPESDSLVVWKLSPDWGYPRGPHGKTRLRSAASRNAAKYRYALSESDAIAMNLHRCSYAPAVAITVTRSGFMTLWDQLSYGWHNPDTGQVVRILDGRHVRRLTRGDELLSQALTDPTSMPATAPTGAPAAPSGSPASSAAPNTTGLPATGGGSPAPPVGDTKPAALALTGSSAGTAVAAGMGALAAGVAALRLRRAAVHRSESAR